MNALVAQAKHALVHTQVAYAHVRGGGELGRAWHAAGRQRNKPNSLHDLNTCLTALHQAGFAHPGRVAGHAFSAGWCQQEPPNSVQQVHSCVYGHLPIASCIETCMG
eukprot:1161389-Pelagomonas_calceolata.AAC.1